MEARNVDEIAQWLCQRRRENPRPTYDELSYELKDKGITRPDGAFWSSSHLSAIALKADPSLRVSQHLKKKKQGVNGVAPRSLPATPAALDVASLLQGVRSLLRPDGEALAMADPQLQLIIQLLKK